MQHKRSGICSGSNKMILHQFPINGCQRASLNLTTISIILFPQSPSGTPANELDYFAYMMKIVDESDSQSTTPSLASSSTISIESTLTSSTTLTRSTVPGPGALSGKAILALGKFTLRGAEFVIIRRRLNVLSSKFPLKDDSTIKGIDGMYGDLLELSRLNMYSNNIREKAFQILLAQISLRETRYLIESLCAWPDVEIQIFLTEVMSLFDPIRLSHPDVKAEPCIKSFCDALSKWESNSLHPLVEFLTDLIQALNPTKCSSLFHAGLLNFLLHLYVTNFRDPLADTERGAIHRTSYLSSACRLLLTSLCTHKIAITFICDHPLAALWPSVVPLPFPAPSGLERVSRRIDAWNSVPKSVVLWRLHSTFDVMLDFTRTISPSILYDICIDLLELSGSETMDMEIRIRALRSLHRVSTRGNVGAQDIIRDYLDLQVTEHSVRVISQVIKSLSRLISTNTPESKFFYLKWDHRDFVINAVPHLIHLFMNLAKYSDKVLTIFVASDVLGILRPFLEMELRGDDSSKRIAVHQDDLLTVYDQSDYSLLDQIKEQGLEALLKPLPEGTGNAFGYRRMLLCRAFNVFLGRGDDREFPELWSMDWDDLPSGLDGSDYAALWINS